MTRLDLIRQRHRVALLAPHAEAAADRAERKREVKRRAQRRWVAKNRANGLCRSCAEPAVVGGRCAYHREQNNAARRSK